MSDKPFRWKRIKSTQHLKRFYASTLNKIREAARAHGYAIGLHGSMLRDFDLIAVPWVEEHSTPDELAEAIHIAACGLKNEKYQWEKKPHNRIATMFPICWIDFDYERNGLGHIDLSVLTTQAEVVSESVSRRNEP